MDLNTYMKFAQGQSEPRAMTLPDQYLSVISFKTEEIKGMVAALQCYYLWQAQELPVKTVDPSKSVMTVLDMFVSASKFDAFLNRHLSADSRMLPHVRELWLKLRDKLRVFWVEIKSI